MDEVDSKKLALENNFTDHAVEVAKFVATIAAVGPFAEILCSVIPNQRMDRITQFMKLLETRIGKIEGEILEQCVSDENSIDLIEEGIWQVARSLSDERREYIATLVANGISSEEIEHSQSKQLLRIVSELSDVEILWLRFYLDPAIGRDHEFTEKHSNIFEPVAANLRSTRKEMDKATLQKSYKEHLVSLRLLDEKKLGHYETTPLGRLLLREIGFSHAFL